MSAYQNIVFSVVYSSECTVTWPAEVADWANRCKNLQKVFLTCCLIVSNPTNLHLRIVWIDWNKLQQQKSGWKKKNKSSKKEFNNNKHFVYFSKALLCWISSRAVINHASSNCFFFLNKCWKRNRLLKLVQGTFNCSWNSLSLIMMCDMFTHKQDHQWEECLFFWMIIIVTLNSCRQVGFWFIKPGYFSWCNAEDELRSLEARDVETTHNK